MQDSYSDQAMFNDEVFKNLDSKQVKNMWEMLVKRGTDLNLTFSNVQTSGDTGSAEWVATYRFGPKKRPVVNKIKASFVFQNGKIIQHKDCFSFYKWSRQALGMSGLLLGWTSFLKSKVQKTAMKGLTDFMSTNSTS